MDRNKPMPATRGPKGKITQQPPDLFIALGAKQSTSRDVDSKRPVALSKSSASHLVSGSKASTDRKRESTPSSLQSLPSSKKLKVSAPARPPGPSTSNMPSVLPTDRTLQPAMDSWEATALDCDASDFFEVVANQLLAGNTDKAISYVLGAIRAIKNQRFKPCKILFNSVVLLCQTRPSLFTNELIVTAILSVLRRDVVSGNKNPNKNNMYNQIMFINALMHAFDDVSNWPDVFVKLYVEDAVGDRTWIDNPYCKPFVDNIITAFNTRQPPKSLLLSETWMSTSRDTGSPLTVTNIDDDEVYAEHKQTVDNWNIKVFPRFTQSQEMVEQIVLEAIKEQLARRQQPEATTKNFVRFLSTACGLVEIRVIAVSRIETWLHNHKLMKPAQELLVYLCYNCSASTQRDIEIVAQLSKLRLKNKPMINFFNNCLREMVIAFPENLCPLLKYTIYNELSNARNTNNLFVVGAMFQVTPEASADVFADICLELLLNKDDYLRSLRALLKEVNRVLRHDFNLLSIAHSLLRERKELTNIIRESEYRDRIFLSLADLVCMCMLLCVSPQVRDASTQSKRDPAVLQAFQLQVSNIQREAVTWLHDTSLRVFRPTVGDFQHVLHKVLFLEQAEHYYKVDSWPGENERNLFLRLASEVPLLQATLLRILLIGISKEHPIGQNEVVEICDQLIRRAANLAPDCLPSLAMEKVEIIDFFFNLCSYNYPENITLPPGYLPPKLAISTLYWKSWLMLLILAAHNPTTFGSIAWNKYPTLRMFMEMCITNHFSFPPPTMLTGESVDDFNTKEQQTIAIEKQKILEFESHLAAASTKMEINEQSSLLLPQLMELCPQGDARRPPQLVLDQLQALNNTHRMGHLLCRSRNPDFLLDIMSRQGGTAHMPWLAELVHSSEGVLAHLPVQCLCEYLLSTAPTEKLTKHNQLLMHLKAVVNGSDPQNACEVLEYLLRRLTSLHASGRAQAIKGLTLVLNPNDDLEVNSTIVSNTYWLTNYISHFLHLNTVRPLLIQFLRQAIIVETNPVHVSNYINFLCTQNFDDAVPDLSELILDLASLIVERSSITSYILPGEENNTLKVLITLFYNYLQRVREPTDYSFHWSENQEQVVVTWSTGEQCTLQILVVHASIIFLTYGPLDDHEEFEALLDLWFPLNDEQPKAYLVDTSEEALLVPDWLKLRMIRSNVSRLVNAAIEKLEASQLVLFIQSFGIPVVSISKLLQTLDKATVTDPKLVVDSVLDKNYMIQLVEVQNRRGAVGGETFVRALEMQVPALPEDDFIKAPEPRKELVLPDSRIKFVQEVNSGSLIAVLNRVFDPHLNCDRVADVNYLCKTIVASNRSTVNIILEYLQKLPPQSALSAVNSQKCISSFFRLIFTRKNPCYERCLKVATDWLPLVRKEDNLLKAILEQFLKENEKAKSMEVDSIVKEENLTYKSHRKMEGDENLSLELGKMLLENEEVEKTGFLIDWLSALELEMANSSGNKLQMDLLFSKKKLPYRPLLISMVLQRASWNSLHNIVTYLLDGDVLDKCPVSSLDFLTALTKSPKLWQGRDKAVPKHHHPDDVLHLKTEQVKTLVRLVLEESRMQEDNWERNMEKRLPLILRSVGKSIVPVVNMLLQASQDKRNQHLLLTLYMSVPRIGSYISNVNVFNDSTAMCSNSSSVDAISHTLLSALTANTRQKDWNRKSKELELCARKLTSSHPHLVLRQLPMLAGNLRGRAHYEWGVLKNRGHFVLFGQILGLMELLQPSIFQQTETLYSLLDSYFLLLKYHGHLKDLNVLVERLVHFLQNWMMRDIQSALKYLQQHGQTLNEIQLAQPSVRPLLSSVSLPIQEQNAQTEQLLVGTATPPAPEQLPQNWPSIIQTLQSLEPLSSLQDLDHLSNKRPQILRHISQHLFNLITSSSSNVRSLALNLLIRYLKYNPKVSSEALPAILSCLENRNAGVVENVLDKLPDIVASMQEHGKLLLTRVFNLGVNNNLNTGTNISKCFALLGLQSGC